MQSLGNFIIENFGLLFFLIIAMLFIVCYKKSKTELVRKTAKNNTKIMFTRKEYDNYKKQAESVLNNTTISFLAKDVNNLDDKMNLYYCTVSVGNRIIRTSAFAISDVGEI